MFAPVVNCVIVDRTVGEKTVISVPEAFVEVLDEVCGADGVENHVALAAASTIDAEPGYDVEAA